MGVRRNTQRYTAGDISYMQGNKMSSIAVRLIKTYSSCSNRKAFSNTHYDSAEATDFTLCTFHCS